MSKNVHGNFIETTPLHGCYAAHFAVYFQSTFSVEHLQRTTSELLLLALEFIS